LRFFFQDGCLREGSSLRNENAEDEESTTDNKFLARGPILQTNTNLSSTPIIFEYSLLCGYLLWSNLTLTEI